MSSCVAFHTQVASIMEVLANAAVAEICKLMDDGYALLRMEMSQSQKENEQLRRKLENLELQVARGCGARRQAPREKGNFLPEESVFSSHMDLSQDSSMQSAVGRDVPADSVEVIPEPGLIKEETSEEEDFGSHSPKEGMVITAEQCLDLGADAGERRATLDEETSPGKSTEELADEHRSSHGAWEVSGLETVLKAEPEKESVKQRPLLTGTECRAEGVSSLACEFTVCQRAGHLKACYVHREIEAGHPADLFVTETDLKSPSESELQPAAVTEASVSEHRPCLKSPGWKSGSEVESLQIKEELHLHLWDRETVVHRRQHRDDRERMEVWKESCNISPPNPQMICKESLVVSKHAVSDRCIPVSSATSRSENQCKASSRERRFLCAFCGKGFSCPKKVEIHQRVHTGEKPFSCTQCRKRFAQSGNLKRHQRVHTGEKPFSCLQCDKRFSHLHQLKMHQRVHTGERPFICMQCGKRFGEKSYLKVHQQKNHMMVYSVK
uniref:C2H2-type domain-containing protein n=1 Tax=Paramormyrops kingsleyae TaxID=1676925 RepID=A0A3B3T1U5_9TELE